jgi:outer membrane translocation and assembly module TamA
MRVTAVAAAFAAVLTGCGAASLRAQQPPRCDPTDLTGCVVERVVVRGNERVSTDDIQEKLVTTPPKRLLGGALSSLPFVGAWERLSTTYDRFDLRLLEQDLARVERLYRAKGYYRARARAGRIIRLPKGRVRVEIEVDEGSPTRLREHTLSWTDWAPGPATREPTRLVAEALGELREGTPLDEELYDAVKARLTRALQDHGFAYGGVRGAVQIDDAAQAADVAFTLTLGPRCQLGAVNIVGLRHVPESDVRAVLGLREGELYSAAALERARYALADLGVFGSIELEPQLQAEAPGPTCKVPLTVTLTESALRAVKAGVGIELGARVEGHVLGAWEHRNLWGGLRHLSAEVRPGVVLWPNQIGDLVRSPLRVLPELRSSVQLRQPNTFERRTTALLSGSFSLYCPLINCRPQVLTPAVQQAAPFVEPNLVGYRELAGKAGLERPIGEQDAKIEGAFQVRIYDPFSYNQPDVPGGYRAVRVQSLNSVATLDLRRGASNARNPFEPRRGILLSGEAQFAGGFIGGDADDIRLRPEFRAYLPVSKRVTLAFRWVTGLLFPRNYTDALGDREAPDQSRARDLQILRLRGFFSGGQSSNRGYGFNQIGPNAPSTLVYPLARSATASGADILQVPVGGLSMWESSLELRFPLDGKLGAVLFLDGSDVALERARIRLDHPHPSCGLGARYDTPVGPLRLDLGWRLPNLQVLGRGTDRACSVNCAPVVQDEGLPTTLWGLPLALAVAIGEAF